MPTNNPNNLAKYARVATWALCGASLLMAADTRGIRAAAPSDANGQQPDTRTSQDDSTENAFEKQWAKAEGWMKEHCPNRYRFVQKLRAGGRFQEQARQQMIKRYNEIQKYPYVPMRDAVTGVFEAQDQVFGAQLELRHAREQSDPTLRTQAESDLRSAVSHLFDAQQNIKHVQIKRHQDEIDRLQGEFEKQERRRTEVVDNWFRNMKNRADNVTGGPPVPSGRPQNASPNDPHRPAHEE